jgi:LysR family transcriptional regulator AphB
MIDLNDMAIFAKVVDQGGFSAAGRALELPKSKISRRVSELEDRLSVRLLERTTRKVQITEVGRVFYRHCKRIEEEAENASVSVSQMLESPRGLLRIGASVTTGQYLVSPLIAEFMTLYPEVQLEIDLSNRRMDILEEGFDLLIRIGQLKDSTLISKRLGESRLFLYASPAYLEARGAPLHPEDLAEHCCLMMSDVGSPTQWRLIGPTDTRRITIVPRATVNDFPSLRQVVLNGGGVAELPGYLCAEHEREGRLLRVLPDWSFPPVEFHALYPSHRGATPKLRVFLDFIGKRMADRLHGP